MEEPYINTSQRTDDLVEKFLNLPDKILLDNFNKISPERRKQIRDGYINMCMNRKEDYYLLFPVDKIFENLPDFLSIKRLNNVNYMKPEGDGGFNSFWFGDETKFEDDDAFHPDTFFKTADEFALYCTKQGGVYSARDRDCIPIEELRGRQAIVILKDEEDGKNENRLYRMSFDAIDDEISNIAEPYAISYKFIKKIDLDKKTVKKTQPVLKRVMRF